MMILDQDPKQSSKQTGVRKTALAKQKQLEKLKQSVWCQIARFELSVALDLRQTQT